MSQETRKPKLQRLQAISPVRLFASAALLLGVPILLGILAFTYTHRWHLPANVEGITKAQFATAGETAPIAVSLPHDWLHHAPTLSTGRYLFEFDLLQSPTELQSVYLPSVMMNAAVYLNNERVGDGGRFTDPVARRWHQPLFISVPVNSFKIGINTLTVEVKADPPGRGLLGPVYIGPEALLRPSFETLHGFRVALPQAITLVLLLIGGVFGALWILRRRDNSIYAWYAGVNVVWALHNFNLFVVNSPVSTRLWDWFFGFLTLGWFTILVIIFTHRYLGLRRPLIERTLLIIGVFGGGGLLLLPQTWFYWVSIHVWDSSLLLAAIYPLFLLVRSSWEKPRPMTYILTISGLAIIVFGGHDWLAINGLIDRSEGRFIHLAAPVPIIAFGWILINDFLTARDEALALNQELEQRIEEKSEALEKNHQRLRLLEREQVLDRERARIMRDIHDGMGGHLVATLAMAESHGNYGQIAQTMREALADLRLMIDSLDPIEDDLALVLGMFRARLQPRLENSDLALNWQVTDLPPIADFTPHKVLNVLRILQEAVTNTIRHSGANELTISTEFNEQNIRIKVSDNGESFNPENNNGRGLNNMRQRATSLPANLRISSDQEGNLVELILPR